MLVVDVMTSNEQTSEYMAALGCHLIVCSLCFLIVNIEILLSCGTHSRGASCCV
ncbi:MAG TPA: hypothetical protein VFH96_08490 [Pyrinomonadaceae bacterium]|nr:hypothetical protein [Pyrinomonadaceae bacterium]